MSSVTFTWTDADPVHWLFPGLVNAQCNVSLNGSKKVVTLIRVGRLGAEDGELHVFVRNVDEDGRDVGDVYDAGKLEGMMIHVW